MKKYNWLQIFLIIFLLITTIVTTACIKFGTDNSGSKPSSQTTVPSSSKKPEIISFKAQPETIRPGESVMLSWEVANVESIEISPTVGKMDAKSTALVQPTAKITYTLTATNTAGSAKQELTVNVLATTVQKPDLTQTDLFIQATTVYMKVKNIGNEDAKGSRAVLYINGRPESNTYVEALKAGESRNVAFDNYEWKYRIDLETPMIFGVQPVQFEVKACLDANNDIAEIDENNNCRSFIYGREYRYSFYLYSHMALWVSNYGTLTWPMVAGSQSGSAYKIEAATMEDNLTFGPIVGTYPQPVSGGWIQGRFGDFYNDYMQVLRVRHIVLPAKVKFMSSVGFVKDAPPNAKAKFMFIAIDDAATSYVLAEKVCANDGKVDTFNVDLSGLAGQQRSFVLRVEGLDAAGQGAVWVDPRLWQEQQSQTVAN